MCMNCGCGEIHERHGKDANIIAEDVTRAATASGLDLNTTIRNLQDSLRGMAGGGMAGAGAGGRASSSGTGMGAPTAGSDRMGGGDVPRS
jgi:hypothetical protein